MRYAYWFEEQLCQFHPDQIWNDAAQGLAFLKNAPPHQQEEREEDDG